MTYVDSVTRKPKEADAPVPTVELSGTVELGIRPPVSELVNNGAHASRVGWIGGRLTFRLTTAQARCAAIQLEEQGFGYGAFWCRPPTVREALWILWSAIQGKDDCNCLTSPHSYQQETSDGERRDRERKRGAVGICMPKV